MESEALRTFRRKMANPLYWKRANRIFSTYTRADLADPNRTRCLIEELASSFGVPLSVQEQMQAANWLVNQGIDPKSRMDRMNLWKKAK